MAGTPAFASAPRLLVAAVSTANTNRDGTGTIVDLAGVSWTTAPAAGTKVTSIAVVATGDPADSIVNIYVHNGTSYLFFDSFDLGNPAAGSATVDTYRAAKSYADLVLPSGYKLGASITAALTAGVVNVFAMAGDLT